MRVLFLLDINKYTSNLHIRICKYFNKNIISKALLLLYSTINISHEYTLFFILEDRRTNRVLNSSKITKFVYLMMYRNIRKMEKKHFQEYFFL